MNTLAENCPWCGVGHEGLELDEASPGTWVVVCRECGAEGPHPKEGLQSVDAALCRWNGDADQ